MYLNNKNITVLLAACSIASAKPIADKPSKVSHVKRAEPSAYPYGDELTNEFQWLGWDPDNDTHKADGQKIHEGFKQWADLASSAVDAANGGTDNVHFKRWFDSPPADDVTAVQNTLKNMYNNGATATVKKMVLEQTDFSNQCGDNRYAYTDTQSGHFHICRLGDLKQNSEVTCADFTRTYINSNPARTLPFAMLHEFTHFEQICDDRFGLIVDHAVSSRDCFALETDDKLENANNYAFHAAEAYWSAQCPDKTFDDPPAQASSSPTGNSTLAGSS